MRPAANWSAGRNHRVFPPPAGVAGPIRSWPITRDVQLEGVLVAQPLEQLDKSDLNLGFIDEGGHIGGYRLPSTPARFGVAATSSCNRGSRRPSADLLRRAPAL